MTKRRSDLLAPTTAVSEGGASDRDRRGGRRHESRPTIDGEVDVVEENAVCVSRGHRTTVEEPGLSPLAALLVHALPLRPWR